MLPSSKVLGTAPLEGPFSELSDQGWQGSALVEFGGRAHEAQGLRKPVFSVDEFFAWVRTTRVDTTWILS
jgi:hypothetical protein